MRDGEIKSFSDYLSSLQICVFEKYAVNLVQATLGQFYQIRFKIEILLTFGLLLLNVNYFTLIKLWSVVFESF